MKLLNQYRYLFLLATSLFSIQGFGQVNINFSGLKNLDLVKVVCSADDFQHERESELPGGGLPEWGKTPVKSDVDNAVVERISVREDRATQLKAEVYFNGFNGGSVKVMTATDKGVEQKEVKSQILAITGSSGMLDIDLSLVGGLPDNFALQSSLIRIIYTPASHSKDKVFCFKLNKRWKIAPQNENIVVKLKPQPYKTAASITTYSATLPPPIVYKPYTIIKPVARPILHTTILLPSGQGKEVNLQPEGPAAQPISFYEEIYKDYDFANPREISDIALDQIYPDKNDTSGNYYYKPSAYSLAWGADDGFKLTMLYGSGTSASDGGVSMSASLSSHITSNEYDFVKKMLSVYLKSKHKAFSDLQVILPNEPKVNLHDNLSAFNIPSDKFAVSVSSSVYDNIDLSWTVKKDDADFLITTLGQNKNIGGEMVYKINEQTSSYSIPLQLMIADKSTFGRFELLPDQWRNALWQNTTPFSVKLKNMHIAIMNNINGRSMPCIYTWTLNNTTVLSKSKVKFDGALVPTWIDDPSKVLRIWMEYEVLPCSECTQEIVDQISSGVSNGRQKSVKFHSMGLLKDYGVTFMKIRIRSRYLDPRGKATLEKTITIDHDRQDYEAGPFYSWDDKDITFEYMISFVNDEKTFNGVSWISSKDQQVFINKTSAQQSLGSNLPPAK
ncbi:MAG TPA: hypothetical protein VFF27_04365 [Bacteroidia bacterium]|jgi:hypothetical protein|nr:hypothetical protein [Bacteroidia bacterium]